MVESFLEDAIYFRQPGSKEFAVLEPGAKKDILFLSNESARLSLRFGDSNRNKWSNPFNIQDLGKVYVKLDKVEGASDLVKCNVVINEATIRIQITQIKEQRLWPYQIKNLTDKTINFYQKVVFLSFYLTSGCSKMGTGIRSRPRNVNRIQLLSAHTS